MPCSSSELVKAMDEGGGNLEGGGEIWGRTREDGGKILGEN